MHEALDRHVSWRSNDQSRLDRHSLLPWDGFNSTLKGRNKFRPTWFLLLTFASCCAFASSLPTRDHNPLITGFGIPTPLATRTPEGTWSLSTSFNWASTALVQTTDDEHLVVDAETKEWRVAFARRLSERWTLELDVPYREIGGGSLDSFIDDWHQTFGLPDGARSEQPRDRMRLHYSRAGTTLIETSSEAEGFADASLTLSRQIFASPASSIRGALSVKLPSGENHWFTSSGGTDLSAILAADHRLGERWQVSGQAAVSKLDDGDLFPERQRDLVWSARAGLAWRATPAVELIMQIDAHTGVYEASELDLFDDAVLLTLGGAYRFASDWTLSLGVSEDILVERSPDVVFVFGLSKGTGR